MRRLQLDMEQVRCERRHKNPITGDAHIQTSDKFILPSAKCRKDRDTVMYRPVKVMTAAQYARAKKHES